MPKLYSPDYSLIVSINNIDYDALLLSLLSSLLRTTIISNFTIITTIIIAIINIIIRDVAYFML